MSDFTLVRGTPQVHGSYMGCRFCGGPGRMDGETLVVCYTGRTRPSAHKQQFTVMCTACAQGLLELLLADLAESNL